MNNMNIHKISKKHLEIIRAILLLFILAEAVIVILFSGNKLRFPDERDYYHLSLSIIHGEGYTDSNQQPTAYRPPGYPFLISLIGRISTKPVTAKIANAFFLVLTAFFISKIVYKSSIIGCIVSLLFILCYPLFAYASSTLYPQIVSGMLFILCVSLTNFNHSLHVILLIGFMYGLLSLISPAFLLIVPIFIILFFMNSPRCKLNKNVPISSVFSSFFLFVIAIIVIISPWSVRNYIHFKSFIPISTNAGINLLLGNSENTTPISGVNVDILKYTNKVTDLNEVERDSYYKRKAIEWVIQNPLSALKLYFGKVLNYFNFRNELATKSESSIFRNFVLFITYYPLLLISVLRLFFFKQYPISKSEIVLYILYFGNAFFSAIFFTRIRFRIPFDFLLIAIVSIFIGNLIEHYLTIRQKVVFPINHVNKNNILRNS